MSIGLIVGLAVTLFPVVASALCIRRSNGKATKDEKPASLSWSTDGFDFRSLPDPGSRVTVTQDKSSGLKITVAPARSDLITLNFLVGLWLAVLVGTCMWLARAVGIINVSVGWVVLLFVWTMLGPVFANARGRAKTAFETILIDSRAITVHSGNKSKSVTRRYDVVRVRNLRYLDPNEIRSGAVGFNHDEVVVGFAAGISRLEAIRLIKTIRLRFRIRDDIDDVDPLPVAVGSVAPAQWDDFE